MVTLFLTKEARIYNGDKDSLFNKWCWENWTAICKRMKLEYFLTPYTKKNSKWIKDLNVRLGTKTERKNRQNTLKSHKSQQDLFWPTPRVMKIKTKINKWDLIKLKIFCTTKETINKWKDNPQNWRKYLPMKQLTRDLYTNRSISKK